MARKLFFCIRVFAVALFYGLFSGSSAVAKESAKPKPAYDSFIAWDMVVSTVEYGAEAPVVLAIEEQIEEHSGIKIENHIVAEIIAGVIGLYAGKSVITPKLKGSTRKLFKSYYEKLAGTIRNDPKFKILVDSDSQMSPKAKAKLIKYLVDEYQNDPVMVQILAAFNVSVPAIPLIMAMKSSSASTKSQTGLAVLAGLAAAAVFCEAGYADDEEFGDRCARSGVYWSKKLFPFDYDPNAGLEHIPLYVKTEAKIQSETIARDLNQIRIESLEHLAPPLRGVLIRQFENASAEQTAPY